jgi:alpha-N-acetylglucosamine transferase
MEFGGIYLDRDVIVIKSLDPLRKFEMTLDYQFYKTYKVMGSQVQIAHKRARFLRLFLQTYKKYNGYQWYWNAGEYPTQRIINKYPHLVHSMHREFGLSWSSTCSLLYLENIKDWREKYFTVHLLMRGNSIKHMINWCFRRDRIPSILDFDKENVKTLETTFGQILGLILYNKTNIIED